MTNIVTLGYEYFPDPVKGRPVYNGSIYIGDPDTDPTLVVNQKLVSVVQENGTVVPVSQPITTSAGGVPQYNGSPVSIQTDGQYSLAVLNNLGVQVYYLSESTDGAGFISYNQGDAGAVDRTVEEKLQESISIEDFGGVGDGATDDTAALNLALATGYKTLNIDDSIERYLVTSLSNINGVEIDGAAAIVKSITGGVQKLNSYVDKDKICFGREYLAAFHNLLIDQTTTPTRQPKIIFSGDSTTSGVGVDADYQISALIDRAGTKTGLQTNFGLDCVNAGHASAYTQQWVDTYLATDLAATPDLYVLRWGINDPSTLQNGTSPPLDAGQDYPNRRTPEDFIASLREGLDVIRTSRNVTSLSILLMTPNSTSDTPNARDELFYEQITPMIKQAARDYQCAFIDTYALLKDSRDYAAGTWMDDPFGDGRAVHPLNVMNTWIAGAISDLIFPTGLQSKIGVNNIQSISGVEDGGDPSRLPSYYEKGVTISRALSSSGFPLDGNVITVRSLDATVIQYLYPFLNAERGQLKYRVGRAEVLVGQPVDWSSWYDLGAGFTATSNATGSRNLGVTYTNGTGGPMFVGYSDVGGSGTITGLVDGVVVAERTDGASTNLGVSFMVPNGSTYLINGIIKYIWQETF